VGASRRTRARLGVALVGYGVAGVLLLAALLVVADSAMRRLAFTDAATGPLAEATYAIADASTAFGGFGTSLADAERATGQAATSARDASTTAGRLADAMSISIFGAQPLQPLAQDFRREAADLDTLAKGLGTLTTSLQANQVDVATIRDDLGVLSVRLEAARSDGVSLEPLRALVLLVALWIALPAFASIAVGIWLLRSASSSMSSGPA
jgi:hypothetical protein